MNENKMGVMPVNKLLITMSLPMMLSMLMQAMYNVVDSIFVSRFSDNALTAVSMAFPAQSLMIALGAGTGVGINALLSYNLGRKNQKEANAAATTGIFLAVVSALAFCLLGLFLSRFFYESQFSAEKMADNPELYQQIIDYGSDYLRIATVFGMGLFLQMTFERLLQSTGKTVYSMITQCTGAILNIVLDYILVFGKCGFPAMGAKGAAIATVIGQFVAMLLAIYFNLAKNKEICLSFRGFRIQGHIIKGIYRVGLPSIIMQSITSIVTYAMNGILLVFSKTAVDVFGIYFKLQSFVLMPVFGLNNGMVPIIAYNFGARKKSRILQTMRLSYILAIAILLLGTVVFWVFPETLLKLFSKDATTLDALVAYGVPALRYISIHFIIAGFSIISTSIFQALGNGLYSMIISICRQLVILLPIAYIMGKIVGNLDLVWLSFPIAEVVSGTMCMFFLIHTIKTQINTLPDNSDKASKEP